MRIFGFEITRVKKEITLSTNDLSDFVNQQIISCNGQLRGIINDKAKEYNIEILQYYMGQVLQEGLEFGIRAEQEHQRNNKLKETNG